MTIYIDPTERRSKSRLPETVVQTAKELPGLEEKTGADILLSREGVPPVNDNLLRRHTESGILVQRKSGNDLPASIVDGRLKKSLSRMGRWGSIPWLLVTGVIEEHNGLAVIDGRPTIEYNALTGALDWWQLRGGSLTLLSDDSKIAWWIGKMLDRFVEIERCPEIVVTKPALQNLTNDPLVSALTLMPGLGLSKATALLDAMRANNTPLSLLSAIEWLTKDDMPKVPGIGDGIRRSVRRWLGLEDWCDIRVVVRKEYLQ